MYPSSMDKDDLVSRLWQWHGMLGGVDGPYQAQAQRYRDAMPEKGATAEELLARFQYIDGLVHDLEQAAQELQYRREMSGQSGPGSSPLGFDR